MDNLLLFLILILIFANIGILYFLFNNKPKQNEKINDQIDSIRTSTDKNSPCSKTPCWAKVKVDNVIGIGQGGPSVSIGDTLYTRFAFTLAETTEELIPNLDKRMPGLNITDSFEANIKSMASNNSDKLYEIYFYTKK